MGHGKPETHENRLWGRGRETSAFEMVLSPFPRLKAGARKTHIT